MENAGVFGFNLHVAFVRLDLGDHVPKLHRVSVLLLPFQQGAFFHRVAHLGHNYFWHIIIFS